MDKVYIYIKFEESEYINYYNMALNDKLMISYITDDNISQLFDEIDNTILSKNELYWCIIQDKDALNWDYESEIKMRGYELKPLVVSKSDVCKIIKGIFKNESCVYGCENMDNNCKSFLYPTNFISKEIEQNSINENKESVICKKNESKQKNTEMTELGKMINKIYGKDENHE